MSIPKDSQPIAGGLAVTPSWRAFLGRTSQRADAAVNATGGLQTQIDVVAQKLGSTDGTVDGIPPISSGGGTVVVPPPSASASSDTRDFWLMG